jgi:Reverse transcriptase (RNA-dependent DNA polymerase)
MSMINRLRSYEITIPKTYKEAMESPQAENWLEAAKTQIDKLETRNTWDLVDIPDNPEVRILPGKWIFDLKADADDFILEYRARWVVCGNFQEQDDSQQHYAPVATEAGIKMMLTKIALADLEWEQVDVVTAYLNAVAHNTKIYIRQPTGFNVNRKKCCLIRRALYGLRDSAQLWNQTFDDHMRKIGFEPLLEDPLGWPRVESRDSRAGPG